MWLLKNLPICVSTTEKCDCESKICMKYGANLLEKSH